MEQQQQQQQQQQQERNKQETTMAINNNNNNNENRIVDDCSSSTAVMSIPPPTTTTATKETNVSLLKGRRESLARPARRDSTHEDDCSSTGAPSPLLVDYHQPPTRSADEGKPPPPAAALEKYNNAVPNSSHPEVVVQPQEQSDHTRNETPQQTRKYDSVAKTSTPEEEGTPAAAATEQSPTKETHRAIPTTAVLNLSPYQRAQLAHWQSIFVQTRKDANDTTDTTTTNRDNQGDNHHDDVDQDVEYNRAVRQLREHMERMKEEQERKLLRSSVARAPSEAAVQVVDLTNNDDDDDDDNDVVRVNPGPAIVAQHQPQPRHSGIKRKLLEDGDAATSPAQQSRDALPVDTTVAAQTMPLSPTTTSSVLGGDLPSEAPALPVPTAPTQDERILAHQLIQAQQEYDNAKAVYSTKLRHYHVLVAQLNNYASVVETGGDTTNLNLLSRQISIFRPFLLEAKAKVNESELRLQQITRHLSR